MGTPSLDDIAAFVATFQAGSTAGAARQLGVHQSTVSRRLSALERELSVRLFDRIPEGLAPTTAALDAIASAKAMKEAADRFAATLRRRDERVAGTVRIAVFTELGRSLIVPRLPGLLDAHPGLSVELVESTGVSDLARREADLAIRLVPPHAGDLVYQKIGSFGFGVFASRNTCPIDVDDPPPLDELPWVRWDSSLAFLPEARWQQRVAPNASVVFTSMDQGTILAAVEAGVGVAVLPTLLGRRHPSLVAIHSEAASELRQPVYLVAHAALRRLPRYDVMWSFLVEVLREAAA